MKHFLWALLAIAAIWATASLPPYYYTNYQLYVIGWVCLLLAFTAIQLCLFLREVVWWVELHDLDKRRRR